MNDDTWEILSEYVDKAGIVADFPHDTDDLARAVVQYSSQLEADLVLTHAEVERLRGIIRKVEWVNLTDGDGNFAYQECSECGYSREHGHHQDCPFRGWEGG